MESIMKVYYLDDEPMLCTIFGDAFTTDEIEVTCFTSASETIKACAEDPPFVIFIDMRLEDTTGDVVAEQLDDTIHKYLVTGDLANTSNYPFKGVISKPFDLMKIQDLLEKHKTE